eukprot:gene16859-23104_t
MNVEQLEELEVLQSIFFAEFELISADPTTFKIYICPNPGQEQDNHVSINLVCEFIADYPEKSPPLMTIEVKKGLSSVHASELLSIAEKVANDNIGMPSIFSITESIKEWLVDNNVAGQDGSMYSEMLRRMNQKETEIKKQSEKAAITAAADSEMRAEQIDPEEIERIRRRQAGTQVTVESFMAWKAAYDLEMQRNRGVKASSTISITSANSNTNAITSIGVMGSNSMKDSAGVLFDETRPT